MEENLREQRCRILCTNIPEAIDYIAQEYLQHSLNLVSGGYDEVVSGNDKLSQLFIDYDSKINEILEDDEPQQLPADFGKHKGGKIKRNNTMFGMCGVTCE